MQRLTIKMVADVPSISHHNFFARQKRKWWHMLWLLPLLCFCTYSCYLFKEYRAASSLTTHFRAMLIGHRGAGSLAPENTLAAIDSGIAHRADFVEIDIHQTSDGKLVVMHDKTVNRTTNGHGQIADLSYSEVSKLSIKDEKGILRKGLRVPLLEEVLAKISKSETKLIIELKNPDKYPGILDNLSQVIKNQAVQKKVMVFSFDKASLRAFRKLMPEIPIGAFCFGQENIYKLKDMDYICPSIYSLYLRPEIVDDIHQLGKKIFVWTLDKPGQMRFALKKDVDGIITNRPDVFRRL